MIRMMKVFYNYLKQGVLPYLGTQEKNPDSRVGFHDLLEKLFECRFYMPHQQNTCSNLLLLNRG